MVSFFKVYISKISYRTQKLLEGDKYVTASWVPQAVSHIKKSSQLSLKQKKTVQAKHWLQIFSKTLMSTGLALLNISVAILSVVVPT